jgi:hypothetical protein
MRRLSLSEASRSDPYGFKILPTPYRAASGDGQAQKAGIAPAQLNSVENEKRLAPKHKALES